MPTPSRGRGRRRGEPPPKSSATRACADSHPPRTPCPSGRRTEPRPWTSPWTSPTAPACVRPPGRRTADGCRRREKHAEVFCQNREFIIGLSPAPAAPCNGVPAPHADRASRPPPPRAGEMSRLFIDREPLTQYKDRQFQGSMEQYLERAPHVDHAVRRQRLLLHRRADLHPLFEKAGPVKTIVMARLDKIKKTPCGFCFVEYHGRDDAERAVKYLNGTKLDDRDVRNDFDRGFQRGAASPRIRRPGSRRVSHHVRRGSRRLRDAPQDGTRRVAGGGECRGRRGREALPRRIGRGERAGGACDGVRTTRRAAAGGGALSAGGRSSRTRGTRRIRGSAGRTTSRTRIDITPGVSSAGWRFHRKNAEATTRGKTETYRKFAIGAPLDRPNLCDSRYITVCSYKSRSLASTTRTPACGRRGAGSGVVRRDGNFSHEGWRRRYARALRDAPPRISRVWAAPGSESRARVGPTRPRAETSARTSPGVASPFSRRRRRLRAARERTDPAADLVARAVAMGVTPPWTSANPGVVTKEVVSTSFSFYDAEEARRISVKLTFQPRPLRRPQQSFVCRTACTTPPSDPSTRTARAPRAASAPCTARATSATSNSPSLSTTRSPSAPWSASFAPSRCLHCGHFKMAKVASAAYARKLGAHPRRRSRRPPPSPSAASAKPSARS